MSALAQLFTGSALRYRDCELTALCVAGEVRYRDRKGSLAFRITEAEVALLSRVAATAGRASIMLFLFLKIVSGNAPTLSAARIAEEVGGASSREVERILASLVLGGLVRREVVEGGFLVRFPSSTP